MPTALELIQGALRKIGEFAPGETLPASDSTAALELLNGLLDIWSNEKLAVYNNVENIFTLTPGKNVYTVGTGGEINIPRPLRVTNMYTRLTTTGSAVDFPCAEISGDKYTAIGLKSQPGPWPKMAYYNTGYPLAQLYFWPVPNAGGEFHLWTDMVLTTLALSDQIQLPQGYYLALQYNLAVILAPEYGTDAQTLLPVAQMAGRLKKILKSTNAAPQAEVPLDVASMSSRSANDAGWILSGGF